MNTRPSTRLAFQLLLLAALNFAHQSAFAHPPTGIVVNRQGIVYFTDLEIVWKLDINGSLTVFRVGVNGRHVHELALDKDDNLLGADFSHEASKWISDVWRMKPNGELTYLLEPTSNPPRGFSMWADDLGNMYFVEQDNHLKKQTLLLRRTPDGQVTTLAGSTYGSRDGKGDAASFGSVGGMFISSAGQVYLTDGTSLRKVSTDGVVTTIATDLNKRTAEDGPPLFGKNDGNLTGLSVDKDNNVYVADAGNQRLLRVAPSGKFDVVYRGESPYYPNGVAVAPSGDLYVLEVGFKPPGTWLPARVRKMTPEGKSAIVAVSGDLRQPPGGAGRSEFTKFMIPQTTSRYLVGLIAVVAGAVLLGLWKLSGRISRA
jgi:sugar lactone lactonase YvrE